MIASEVLPAPGKLNPRYIRWKLREGDASAEVMGHPGLHPVVAGLLGRRGVVTAAEAERFVAPAIEQLHDPYLMLGMAEAVARVQAAIGGGEPILIYGDYDVDGTTAIVLLRTALERLGGKVRHHVPHRLREGYGMQAGVLAQAAEEGVRLVISVDTGVRAYAAAEEAARLGLDLIVTDHHLPEADRPLPRALAVLNPNQAGCGYPTKHLCGAGVAFKLAQALLEAQDRKLAREKLLPSFLRMLAIATVADAVPLLGENRVIASLGIATLGQARNPGLRSLMELAEVPQNGRVSATEIAFRLAPRINAAGRMDVGSDVVELFLTRDTGRARELATKLHRLNQERREAEAEALREIEGRLAGDSLLAEAACVVVDGEGWHRGVLGILASRVVERTNRPALVVSHEGGEAYGSGRSVAGYHLLGALESCRELFTRFGGHAYAVGFSLPSERVEELRERLRTHAAGEITPEMREPTLECDALLGLDEITPELYAALRALEPYGMGNEEPVFMASGARLFGAPLVFKERHVRLRVGAAGGSRSFAALGWRMAERVVSAGLGAGERVDVAFRLRENLHPEFGGLELEIVDMRSSAEAVDGLGFL